MPRRSPGRVRRAPGWTKGLDGSAERHGVARTVARTVTVGLAALLGIAPAAGAVTVGDSGGTTYQGAQGGPFYGMNVGAETDADFLKRTQYETRVFTRAYYLWPIPLGEIQKSTKLVQNPGW